MLSAIAVFAISAGILLAAQSGCIGATLTGTDGSYDTPDTGLSGHALVQAVTAWEGMTNLSAACQIADTFADMLSTGILDVAYAVHAVLSLTAVDNIADTTSLVLDGARGITTFESGGHTYAAVAAYRNSGVQILNITNPSNITATDSITDGGTLVLRGVESITTFVSGGHTYAAVAANSDFGVQILDVTNPSNITAAGRITDDDISLELEGATDIATFVSGGHTYAAVTGFTDNGVQILNITNPSNITATDSIEDGGSLELWGPTGITTFVSGGHTYAAVAAYHDNGVQILNVTNPSNITAAGHITDDSSLKLRLARDITTFESGGHTYAAVAAYLDDSVQILNVTNPSIITAAGHITNTSVLELDGPRGITTFESGGHTYAAVAAYLDDGVQILDVTNPSNITAAGNIPDTTSLELDGAQGITTFESGSHIYAAIASNGDDNGVQIIRIDIPPDTTLSADAFVTTWRTTSEDQEITINFVGSDMNISWGDGTTVTGVSVPQTHTYTDAGDYTVSVTGGLTGLTLDRPDDFAGRLVPELASIDQWGGISWTNMSNAFAGASNMVYNAPDTPDLSDVTDMSHMFNNAIAFDGDISSWDVSSVTDMNDMFTGASSFNQTLNTWDVSSVTDMNDMFTGASSFNQPLNDWDVSSVINMNDMFFFASSFDGDISSWDVSSVTVMSRMFTGASSFNQTLNTWDVSSVTDMNEIFIDAVSFNRPLNSWDVSSVTDMTNMFNSASSFNQPLNDWDVSSVTDMDSMFVGAASFNQPLNAWDVSSVTDMRDMFAAATDFDQNLGNWYVVPDSTSIAWTAVPGIVGSISAQNTPLNDHTPMYGIGMGGDSDLFGITDGNKLNMTSVVDARFDYTVNVTASDGSVFENGNNWKVLEITVSGSTNGPPVVLAGDDQTVGEGDTVTLSGNATDPNGDSMTYTWSQTDPAQPSITFVNASESSTTFVAPAVTGDTVFTIALTADDGTQSAEDTLEITVKETGTAFITTWTASDSDKGITLPLTGTYSVLWGDDSYDAGVRDSKSHTYDVAGNYTVTVLGDGPQSISLFSDNANALQLESIEQWGGTEWTTMDDAFEGASNMVYRATDAPDLSKVTHTSGMFWGASSFDGDLSGWNVSNVTNMFGMFSGASSFNQTLNSWDVSSVTDMSYMFFGASSFNQTLNSWDVSSVTDIYNMFERASSFNQPLNGWNVSSATIMTDMFNAASSFNQPLNAWDVSSATAMSNMFDDATAFNQNLGNWYVVPDSTSIAWTAVPGIVGSISAQNTPLNDHTPMYGIGMGGDSDLFGITDGNKLNMTSVVDARFDYTVNVTASDGSVFENGNNWKVLEITVSGSTNGPPVVLAGDDQTVGEGDTVTLSGNATDPNGDSMTYTWSQTDPAQPSIMFVNASASSTTFVAPVVTGDTTFTIALTANDGTQSAEDTLKITVKETSAAFITTWTATSSDKGITLPLTGTYSVLWGDDIYSPDVSGSQSHTYDVAGDYTVTVLGDGLQSISLVSDAANALQLKSIDQWGSTEWTTMDDAFSGATNMVYRATNAPDLSGVTSMSSMFFTASSFNGDISGWDVSYVTDMSYMFFTASSFNHTLNGWNVSFVTDMYGMFWSASSFNHTLNGWDVSSVDDMGSMFRDATSFDQPLNNWDVSSVDDMGSMFRDATSFDQPLNDWDVSSADTMADMFDGATAFDQNLGNWYIVPNSTSIALMDVPGIVGSIFAQNMDLIDHKPVYNVTGSDSAQFEIVNGNELNMTSVVDAKFAYTVNVTASGGAVFQDGNYWRVLDVTVTTASDTEPPTINLEGSNSVTITVGTTYNDEGATCDDGINGPLTPSSVSTVDINTVGSYTVTYSCTDAANNDATPVVRTVTVREAGPDTEPPTITLEGGIDIEITVDGIYNEQVACEDTVDDSPKLSIEGSIDTTILGEQYIFYTCTDESNNSVTVLRTVTVVVVIGTLPTIDAGDDQDVTKGSTYTLTGATATDIEDADDTLTIEWTQVPTGTVTITNGNTLTPTIEVPSTTTVTSVTLTMSVTDSANPAVTDTRVLTIQDAVVTDTPPTIYAGADQDVTKGSTYTLTGATATDIEDADDTLTIEWTQVPAGTVTITNGNTLTPAIEVPSTATAPSVTLTMSVTDSANPAVTDTRVLTIQDAVVTDTPPTIYAGADQDVTKGSTYTLTGATATDIEDADDTLTIEWTQVPTGTVTITNGNTLTPAIEVPSTATAPSVTLTMSVTDSANPAVTDTRVLTIQDAVVTDTPPTIDAGDDQDVTKGSTYTLTGATATDIEDADDTLTIEWTQVPAGTVTITNGNTLTPAIEVPSTTTVTSVTLTMRVTDSANPAVTDTRVLTIQDAVVTDTPPTIYAGADQDVTKGSTVTLTGATATDIEDADDTLTIEWTQVPAGTVTITNGNTLTPAIEVPSTTTVTSVTLTMRVTDSANPAVTDTRVLTIQDAVVTDTPPTIYAGADQDVTKGSTYTLTGATATDIEDDDDTLTIEWTQVPAGTVTITNGNTLTPTIEVPSTATAPSVTLTMRVTDSANPAVTDTRVLTIQDAVVTDTPPTIYAGADQDVTKGSTVTLTGATATDIEDDDDTLTIEWTQVPAGTVTITNGNTLTPTIEVPSTTTVTSVTLTMRVTDSANPAVTDTRVLTIQDAVVTDTPPTIYAGADQDVTKGSTVTLTGATATDIEDADDTLTIEWTQVPAGTVTITNGNTLTPAIEVPSTTTVTSVTLTMRVTDSANPAVTDTRVLTIQDAVVTDTPPTIDAGDDQDVTKGSTYTLTGATATDIEDDDDTLTIEWTQVPAGTVTITNGNTLTPTIEVPSTATAPSVTLTMRVTDSDTNEVTDARVLTIQDVVNTAPTVYAGGPLRVALGSSVSTNPTVDDPDGDTDHTYTWTQSPVNTVTFSDVNSLRPTITAPASTPITSVTLTLTVVDGGHTVSDDTTLNIYDPATISNKKSSSSSSTAPIVDLNTLVQARIVDIPPAILEQISSHDASDPLEPILHDDTFDCPLTINEYCYLLDDLTNTLTPQTVTADQSTEIAFTVYTKKDLTHFTLYLNMQGNNANYADSDTYITYTSDGTVEVTDPHGYIGSATVTVTQEDDQIPEKKTVRITVEFAEPMGPTNMVAYMWNTDRKAAFIKIIDAFEVVAVLPEPAVQAADPEPVAPDFADDTAADPEPVPVDTTGSGDYDEAQVLTLIRMWSGFESEFITDEQLLDSLGLDYPDADIPDWVMTELGVLAAKGDVTVDEFMLALQYVLENL